MNRLAAIARQTYTQFSRGLLLLGSGAVLAAVISAPVRAEVKPDPGNLTSYTGHAGQSFDVAIAAVASDSTPKPANGPFHAIWATDLDDLYLGIVVSTDEKGQQVASVYYWDDDWFLWGTGTITDNILSGQLNEKVGDGTFRFTLLPDGQGFDAEATGLRDQEEVSFKGGFYLAWEEPDASAR